jgi:hypothetical protein
MDIRKIIQKEVKKVMLNEFKIPFSNSFKNIPSTFDHLKWEFNPNQKFYLQDLCEVDPDSLSESDYRDAAKFLGISEKNVKSIVNTYSSYSPLKEGGRGDSVAAMNSRLTLGNKAANAFDIGIENNASLGPIKSAKQLVNHQPSMSPTRREYELYKQEKDRKLYRSERGEEHPSKIRERFYESLSNSLMLYLFCEAKPRDINLREDDKIQLDLDSVIEENKFNKLSGGLNYENEQYRLITNLLKEFNDKFGCSYVIYDHIELDGGVRFFVEHNATKQVDMSQDSIAMMKKFLLPRIITGHKIQTNDPSIASLMGLDAGDTTWLYGKSGEPMQSGVLSKIHKGRA